MCEKSGSRRLLHDQGRAAGRSLTIILACEGRSPMGSGMCNILEPHGKARVYATEVGAPEAAVTT